VAFDADGGIPTPTLAKATVGDLVDPTRPGSPTALVNTASRAMGDDAAAWSVFRLRELVRGLEPEGD